MVCACALPQRTASFPNVFNLVTGAGQRAWRSAYADGREPSMIISTRSVDRRLPSPRVHSQTFGPAPPRSKLVYVDAPPRMPDAVAVLIQVQSAGASAAAIRNNHARITNLPSALGRLKHFGLQHFTAFLNRVEPVDVQVFNAVHLPAQPANFHQVYFRRCIQTEVHPQVVL